MRHSPPRKLWPIVTISGHSEGPAPATVTARESRGDPDRIPRRSRGDRTELRLHRGRGPDPGPRLRAACSPTPTCPASTWSCPTSPTCGTTRSGSTALLTHGHEDHIGALPFLLRELSFPIYGSPLALDLARGRIEEAGMLGRTELIPVQDGERRKIGPFDVRVHPRHPLGAARLRHRVPHAGRGRSSTPATSSSTSRRSTAAAPTSPCIGDIAGRDSGVRLLLSDSTNAEEPGFTPQRVDVGRSCGTLFREPPRPADHRHVLRQPHPPRSSRSSTPRSPTAAGRDPGPLDGQQRRASRREMGVPRHPRGRPHRHRRDATTTSPATPASSPPVSRANRCPRWRSWPPARTSGSKSATDDVVDPQPARHPRQRDQRRQGDRRAAPRRRRGRARPASPRCTSTGHAQQGELKTLLLASPGRSTSSPSRRVPPPSPPRRAGR